MSNTAVAYFRTSSSANVGDDRDSQERQRLAVSQYAGRHGIEIVHEYYDAAVKGTDAVDIRPGFAAMIAYMNSNGARSILVESASRFARDLIVQETGYQYLKQQGFTLVAVDDPDAFTSDTPTAVMIRQILGAVSQFEKASIVAKLAGARLRARAKSEDGRCEGPKQAPEAHRRLAQRLKGEGLALRTIADKLAQEGFLAPSGKVYGAESIKRMV
jgi:DNA invertase Pin-like site-specific DNA recombinase